jgi:hypothetical protein
MMARKTYKSFVFGETLLDTIETLPESERGRFMYYINVYGIRGEEPELGGMEKAVWIQIKALIDEAQDGRRNNGRRKI